MPQTKCGFDDGANTSGSELLVTFGPTLIVDIGFDSKYDPASLAKPPAPGIKGIHALVDTGATESCIDNLLAAQLILPIVDRRRMAGAHGSRLTNMYLAQIHIPSLGFTLYGAFAGVDLVAGGQPQSALMGRTFLQHFTMTYEGPSGSVILSND